MQTIITHPNFDILGENLVKNNPNLIKGKLSFEAFPDGWTNNFIQNVDEEIQHQNIMYIADLSKKEYLFDNYATIRGILDYNPNKIDIIVPFFPVGTMERISKRWEIATSKYMADILSNIPQWCDHKPYIHIFDIHSLEQKFFFDTYKVSSELHSAMGLIKDFIDSDTIIVFPDAGARKRFENDFSEYENIHCSKKRKWLERIITIESECEIQGKSCIIIDDLIQSGGTIVETAKKLRELDAKKIDAFATHGVFVKDAEKKLTEVLDTLYTTDSIPENYEKLKNISNAKIISLEKFIEQKIIRK